MIKYILFDFDGTLVDSKEVFMYTYNQLAEKYSFKKMREVDIEYLRRLSIPERIRFFNFPLYLLPFLVFEFFSLYRNSIKDLNLVDGIKSMLTELKNRGYQLAIISSNAEQNIREFLQDNQIDYIHDIFSSRNIFGKDKTINRFLETKQLTRTEVIYVGDELRDIMACKKSGIKIIWVGWGYDVIDLAAKESPDYIVYQPKEILSLV